MAKKADILTPENILRVQGWARDGLTLDEIAKNLDIAKSTLCKWKDEEKELSDALKIGRDVADRVIENALYKAAAEGNITAQIFWLKNRKPQQWRDGKALEIAGQLETAQPIVNLSFAPDEENITNPYYLAEQRIIKAHSREWLGRWKQNNLNEYDDMVAACDEEIKARQAEGGAV